MTQLTSLAPGLVELEPGLFASERTRAVSYPSSANEGCFELEETSFWFLHRNAVVLDTIERWPPPGVLVDVGGGNGFVTRALVRAGWQVILLEPGRDGARHARERGIDPVVCAPWEEAGFLPETLGAVGLFDVLEHVAEEGAFLRSLGIALVPGGRLYVTVPAHPWLWSQADAHAGHFRRYTCQSLSDRLAEAGFTVEWVTHCFSFLVLPILLGRRLSPGRMRDLNARALEEHRPQGRLTRAVLSALCRSERALLARGLVLPAGSTVLAVAKKA